MSVEGSLEAFRLSDILQVVAHQRKTGILTVQGESDIVAISFLRGQVVAADALTRTVEDGLGDVLVRQGLLTREHFDTVAARNQAGAGRLIDLLVEGGRVGRPALLAALREQTQTVLLELLDWQQGEFKFYSGDEVSFEDGFVPISIEELLLRHLEVWEGGAAAVPDDDAVHERLEPPPREIRERLGEPRPGEEEQEDVLWLSPEEMQVWDRVDGQATTAELVTATGLDPHKVRLALHRLLKAGVVAVVGVPGVVEEAKATQAAPAAQGPRLRPSPPAAAIAVSSSPAPVKIGRARAKPRRPRPRRVERWLAVGLGLALAVATGAVLATAPERLLLPFPWQAAERSAQIGAELDTAYLKIDRAAKTFFLLTGRFPDRLERLVDLGLLGAGDLAGPAGRPLAYSVREEGYTLRAAAGGEEHGDAPNGASEAITGNFLLDPELLSAPMPASEPPLVLLD